MVGDDVRGKKGRPSRKERLFWEKFPDLLMDDPDEEINNELIGLLRNVAQDYFKRTEEIIKWFVSAIIPNVRQVGIMQFEATEAEHEKKAEELCPVKAGFQSYRLKEFDDNLPVGEFIDAEQAKKFGY